VNECICNNWYVVDIKNGRCELTLLEINDATYIPEVFVWTVTNDSDSHLKEIFYKSRDTKIEYTGDCYDEQDP